MNTADDPPYRYELWRLDTLVHVRVTGQYFEPGDPVLAERGPFDGYPVGYHWRIYRRARELCRWAASETP